MKNISITGAVKTGFFLITLFWVITGIVSFIRIHGQDASLPLLNLIIAFLMFANAAALLVCGLGISSGKNWLYLFSIAVLAVNILLTVTDQFGLFDLLTLLLDLSLLTTLLVKRSVFVPSGRKKNKNLKLS